MKKGFLLILCSLYLFAASGVKVAVHYCHGHFETISLNGSPNEDACCKKRPMKKRGCCNDKVIEVKIKSDQKVSSSPILALNFEIPFAALHQTATFYSRHFSDEKVFSPLAHGPPRAEAVSALIMNSTFRI